MEKERNDWLSDSLGWRRVLKIMKKESWFYKLLKWLGLIKTYEVSKKQMCENAKPICDKNCETCAWNEQGR